ncbi:MAG: hypothetical protein ACFE9L_10555 [Candidatus Hodarchaeota archaeon]
MADIATFIFTVFTSVLTALIIYTVAFFIKDFLETRKLKKITLEKLLFEIENNKQFMDRFPSTDVKYIYHDIKKRSRNVPFC